MSTDVSLIKQAHAKVNYTPEQIAELKACMHPDTGPHTFISNYIWVQHPTKGRLQLKMFDFQEGLLDSYHRYRKSCGLVSRQMGKCLESMTYVTVKNKNGNIYEIPIGKFYEYIEGKQSGKEISIEEYRKQNL
jgi:hypothetical protein